MWEKLHIHNVIDDGKLLGNKLEMITMETAACMVRELAEIRSRCFTGHYVDNNVCVQDK